MTHQDLAKEIYRVAHLTGTFKLRSGKISSEYFDKYRFESDPKLLREIARQLAPLIPKNTEVLAGLEMGGVPVATALSLETGLPAVYVRKQAKDYGTCQFAEGLDVKGRQLCVVEDVITTGGQVIISAKDLRQLGAKLTDVICVIYRGDGAEEILQAQADLKMHALFTKSQLDSAAK